MRRFWWALILLVFFLDRATKVWAISALAGRASIRVLPFFHLTYVENTGAAFGTFRGGNTFFIVVSLILMGVLLVWRRRFPSSEIPLHLGVSMIIGGALGNFYDRVVFGYVVDFLDFLVWPVFNVADSCISVGAGIMVLALYKSKKRK